MAQRDDDWFRSSRWSPSIAEDFEAKLARARSSRSQYLRIQGAILALQDSREVRAVGRDLLRRMMREYPDDFFVPSVHETLGESFLLEGDLNEAEAQLRSALELVATRPTGRSGTSGTTELALAEVLYRRGTRSDLLAAAHLLSKASTEVEGQAMLFPKVLLRQKIAQARVAYALRLPEAAVFAREALDVSADQRPRLRYHPELGIARMTGAEQRELWRIVRRAVTRSKLP